MQPNRKERKFTRKFRKRERRRINAIIYAARDHDIYVRRMQKEFHDAQLG